MSKTQLKKELAGMDREQMIEFVTELYSACRAARPYFDFYCDPKPAELFEKYSVLLSKEIQRGKYYHSTARISKVKAAIRDFASFGVEKEMVIDLILYAVRQIINVEQVRQLKEPMRNGCAQLVNDALALADQNGIFSYAAERVTALLDGSTGKRRFIDFLRKSIAEPTD